MYIFVPVIGNRKNSCGHIDATLFLSLSLRSKNFSIFKFCYHVKSHDYEVNEFRAIPISRVCGIGNSCRKCDCEVTVSEIFIYHFYENPKISTFICGKQLQEDQTRIIF